MDSLFDYFTELELAFTVITETWFENNKELERIVCDAKNGHNVGLINNCCRREGLRNIGGGTTIATRLA